MTIGIIILWTILAVIIQVVILVSYFRLKIKKERKKQLILFVRIFEGAGFSTPTLKFGSSYGWPTFTVTFASKVDFETARNQNLINRFKNEMASFYGVDFRADIAVTFKYLDEFEKLQFA